MQRSASRWMTMAFAVGALMVVAAAPAQVLRKFLVTDMGTLTGGRYNVPKRMNLDGLTAGYVQKSGGLRAGFLFDNPVMYDLGVLPGRTDAWNNWINRFNVVVGTSGIGLLAKGFVWNNGNMSILPDSDPIRDWPTEGTGVNDAGSVVWNEDTSGSQAGATFKSGVWRTAFLNGIVPPTGQLLTMHATAISNLDWVAGVGPKDDGSVGAWIFQLPDPANGGRTPTEVNVSTTPGEVASVTDLSDISFSGDGQPSMTGMVGGFVRDGQGNPTYHVPTPFITLGSAALNPILLPGHNVGEVYGIANDATAVGRSGFFEIRNGIGLYTWVAVAYVPVLPFEPYWQAFPISDYMPANSGITLDNVLDVNDVGQMVATYTQAGQIRSLLLTPTITPISITTATSSLPGGFSTVGEVVIDQQAPFGGITVNLTTSNAIVAVPPTLDIPAGEDTGSFNVQTSPVLTTTSVVLTAERSGYTVSTTLRLQPTALDRITVSPTFIPGGKRADGTVFLAGTARTGGFPVSLASTNPVAIVASSVTVPTGASQAPFIVYTVVVTANTNAQIRATANGITRTANVTVATPFLEILEVTKASVFGGQTAPGYVQISGPAMAPGAVVALTSSSPTVASVPASVTVLTGTRVASFTVNTVRLRFNTNVTISGTFNTQTRTKTLLVKAAALYSITTNPGTVRGGVNSVGKATLTWYPFTGGAVVSLVSGDNSVVVVPPSVTVPTSTNSATFPITTAAVATNRVVTITGNYQGITKVGTITVTP